MAKITQNQPSTEPNETTPQTIESNFSLEVSTEAQNKIVRLFTYLEKALSLDDTVVRNFRTAMTPPSPWWLADYPRDLENLYIRSFDRVHHTDVPEYSVHDIARIGNSKAKLKELIDNSIFHIDKIPSHIKLTDIQQSQVDTYVMNKVLVEKEKIKAEFDALTFPLYFLDYETFPAAIPRFDGFSPYHQIPFQYSVDVLKSPESKLEHYEFLHVASDDPSKSFAESLQKHLGTTGSIIVWHKGFECGRNDEIAIRIPEMKSFMDSLKGRVYDLEDIFRKQYHIHRDFRGGTSIKRILPVLVPELSYKELEIRDGGSAADTWNKIVSGSFDDTKKEKSINDLKIYCGLDTYAMYSIWLALQKLFS